LSLLVGWQLMVFIKSNIKNEYPPITLSDFDKYSEKYIDQNK
jgi:hypothetical protein